MKKAKVTKIVTTHDEFYIKESIDQVIDQISLPIKWFSFFSLIKAPTLRGDFPHIYIDTAFVKGEKTVINLSKIVSVIDLGKCEIKEWKNEN